MDRGAQLKLSQTIPLPLWQSMSGVPGCAAKYLGPWAPGDMCLRARSSTDLSAQLNSPPDLYARLG